MAPQIPKTCKAQVAESANAGLVLKDVEVKMPQDGEVLIKVLACGVCHSDSGVISGAFGNTFPRIPGHEVIGDIVAVGPSESRWTVGARVGGGWHGGHDATCAPCQRGRFQMCDAAAVNGVSRDGGYAQYCILRSEAVVSVPSDLSPAETAPLLCAGVTLFNSVRNMGIMPGSTVAVQGLGGLGHLGLQYVRRMGYRTVAVSSSDAKREFATKLGATDYIDGSKEDAGEALQKMGGAALVVLTAPNPQLVPKLLKGIEAEGNLLILAPVGEVPVDTLPLIMKGIKVRGWPSGHALDSEEAIRFAQHQDVKCMVEEFPLEKATEALERMESGKVRFRAVLVM